MNYNLDKLCTRCQEYKSIGEFYTHKRDGYSSWCKDCSREYYHILKDQGYFREYYQRPDVKRKRAKVIAKYEKHPYTKQPRQARRRARYLVDIGVIEMQPCVVCGNTNAELHHPDYNESGIVVFLCRNHHQELHKKEGS